MESVGEAVPDHKLHSVLSFPIYYFFFKKKEKKNQDQLF